MQKCKYIADLKAERLIAIRGCLTNLTEVYDIEREFDYMQSHRESMLTIKEQMALAFPGNYGLFIAMHFGRFLSETIDTEEKRTAYHQIIDFLDHVALHIDPELEEFMSTVFSAREKIDTALIEQQSHDHMSAVLDDTQGYLDSHHDEIEQYIQFKLSDEFKASLVGRLQDKML
ncbi:MAG: MerR family transcriptional regulator, partial [Clostridiales bacterium]|nr:MerR family transcriptional regulator [Clostridiales bacterium]